MVCIRYKTTNLFDIVRSHRKVILESIEYDLAKATEDLNDAKSKFMFDLKVKKQTFKNIIFRLPNFKRIVQFIFTNQ